VSNLTGIDVCDLSLTKLILLRFYRVDYTGLGSIRWSSVLKLAKASKRSF